MWLASCSRCRSSMLKSFEWSAAMSSRLGVGRCAFAALLFVVSVSVSDIRAHQSAELHGGQEGETGVSLDATVHGRFVRAWQF